MGQCVLKAIILYVECSYPPPNRNIGEAYQLLIFKSAQELDALFDVLPLSHPARAPYQIYRHVGDAVEEPPAGWLHGVPRQ